MRLSTLSRIIAGLRTQQITLALGKKLDQRRQLGGPTAVGVEDHGLRGDLGVEGVENGGEQPPTHVVVDEHRAFVAGACLGEHRAEERINRTAHAGDKARVLPQERGEQGRARPRQAGNEVEAVLHGAACHKMPAQDAPAPL
jgi:hypothetical protein